MQGIAGSTMSPRWTVLITGIVWKLLTVGGIVKSYVLINRIIKVAVKFEALEPVQIKAKPKECGANKASCRS